MLKKQLFVAFFAFIIPTLLHAATTSSAGLTLLEAPSARPAALGEAYSAMNDDVSAFGYNPASIHTLNSNQVSILYQRGITDDKYGQIMLGLPHEQHSLGFSMSYYSAGDVSVFDGQNQRTVNGQTDLVFSGGAATNWRNANLGASVKFINSTIADKVSANAVALDAGVNVQINKRFTTGAAIQNMGSQMKYASMSDELPRIARLGLSYKIRSSSLFLLDFPYDINASQLNPAMGFETSVGPLALRVGYKHGSDLEEYSIGTGFTWASSRLDYSFGLVDKLDSRHMVSFAYRFGSYGITPLTRATPKEMKPKAEEVKAQPTIPAAKVEKHFPVFEVRPLGGQAQLQPLKVYTVKQGETLKTIARSQLGSEHEWEKIYKANQHLLSNPENLLPGQKILIPQKDK